MDGLDGLYWIGLDWIGLGWDGWMDVVSWLRFTDLVDG